MEGIEVSGKTVEEATHRALEQLGLSREQVEVTILKKGKAGILRLGAEEAKIRVVPLPSAPAPTGVPDEEVETEAVSEAVGQGAGVAKEAQEILENLLSEMKIVARVELKPATAEEGIAKGIVLEVKEIGDDDMGILIGRRGQTLASLQYLTRLILAHRFKTRVFLTIDVEGYKQRHYTALRRLALQLAEKVESSGQPATLEPMPASERRIVHLALANSPEVTTESLGDGETRKVVIRLRKQGETKPAARGEV